MDKEQRRNQVYDFLIQGSSEKLLYHGTEPALKIIQKAYNLTFDDEGKPLLDQPFPALVSYRKALLTFRKKNCTQDDLLEIDELFRAASVEKCLGPWPRIYRLAVLKRLKEYGCVEKETIKLAHSKAINSVVNFISEERKYLKVHSHFPTIILQHDLFNCLELATFFLNEDYSEIDGKGRRYHSLNQMPYYENNNDYFELFYGMTCGYESWSLFGPSNDISYVKYPKKLALVELEERAKVLHKENEPSLIYVLDPGYSRWKAVHEDEWQCLRREDQRRWNYILTYYLERSRNKPIEEIDDEIAYKFSIKRDNLRQTRDKIKRELIKKFPAIKLQDDRHLCSLLKKITIYGAVDLRTYEGDWS